MSLTLSPNAPAGAHRPGIPLPFLALLLTLLLGGLLYYQLQSTAPLPDFPVAEITEDFSVDWTGGGPDFDPWDRCPEDFFAAGFTVLVKRLKDGSSRHFFYHKAKQLLYRIDPEGPLHRLRAGLHWVAGTKTGAKYRIADPAFKGGKKVAKPTGTTTRRTETYQYGQAVSKKQSRWGRELFRPTHITTDDNCPDWAQLFNL